MSDNLTINDLHEGAEVYWNDPDDGICSGWYIIEKAITDEIVLLRNDAGSELEAYISELS
jgi:hypothetical protein